MSRPKNLQAEVDRINRIQGYKESDPLPENQRVPEKESMYPFWMDAIKVLLLFGPGILVLCYSSFLYDRLFYGLGFLVMPVLSTLARRKIKAVVVFILISVLMSGWLYAASAPLLLGMGAIFCFLLLVYGIARKNSQTERSLEIYYLGLTILLVTVMYAVDASETLAKYMYSEYVPGSAGSLLVTGTVIYTGVFLFYLHRIRLLEAFQEDRLVSGHSASRTIRFNNRLFFVCFLFLVGLFVFFRWLGLGTILSLLWNYALVGLRRTARFIFSISVTEEAKNQEWKMIEATGNQFRYMFGIGETWAIWDILYRIMEVLAILLFLVLLCFGSYRLWKRFYYRERFISKDYVEQKEFITRKVEGMIRRPLMRSRGPSGKVRREYYRLVRPQYGRQILPSDTPMEAERKGRLPEGLAERYELVRYRQ